jgi:hypothetical protein
MVAAGPADAKVDPGSPADTTIAPLPPEPPPATVIHDPPPTTTSHAGLDAESIGLGAISGLALGAAAGVGVTYVVRRRTTPHRLQHG